MNDESLRWFDMFFAAEAHHSPDEMENLDLLKARFGTTRGSEQAFESLVVLCIDRGDEEGALQHARAFVRQHPACPRAHAVHGLFLTNVVRQHRRAWQSLVRFGLLDERYHNLDSQALLCEHKLCDYATAHVAHIDNRSDGFLQFRFRFLAWHAALPKAEHELPVIIAKYSELTSWRNKDACISFLFQEDCARDFARARRSYESRRQQVRTTKGLFLDNHVYLYYARFVYFRLQNARLAVELLDEALGLDPDYGEAHLVKAAILMDAFGEYNAARKHLDQVLRINTDHVEALERSGAIALFLGEITAAKTMFRSALDLDPSSVAAKQALQVIACQPRSVLELQSKALFQDLSRRDQSRFAAYDKWCMALHRAFQEAALEQRRRDEIYDNRQKVELVADVERYAASVRRAVDEDAVVGRFSADETEFLTSAVEHFQDSLRDQLAEEPVAQVRSRFNTEIKARCDPLLTRQPRLPGEIFEMEEVD